MKSLDELKLSKEELIDKLVEKNLYGGGGNTNRKQLEEKCASCEMCNAD